MSRLVSDIELLVKRKLTSEEQTRISASVAIFINNKKADLLNENCKTLISIANEINVNAKQIAKIQDDIVKVVAVSAREILVCDNGPVSQLDVLVKKQTAALEWLNRAANYYANNFVLWPMFIACLVASIVGGMITKYI